MRRLVSSLTALAADRAAEELFDYPPELLMEEAGIRLQDRLEQLTQQLPGTAAYLVGSGNNGGDALVMARQAFLRGRTVVVVYIAAPKTASCLLQSKRADQLGIPQMTWPSSEAESTLKAAAFWVDGIFGSGLTSPVRPETAAVLTAVEKLRNQTSKPVIAVDVPSGTWERRHSAEPALTVGWTLSAGPPKDFCFYPANRPTAGTLVEVPLAFPQPAQPTAELLEESDLPALVPRIGVHDHKGRRGHVALAGGAQGMTGALVLASRAAAATGAGLISLGTDSELISLVAPQVPSFQTRPAEQLLEHLSRYDALVVGPGWGRSPDRPTLLSKFWNTDLPLVLDADGLAAWVDLGRPHRRAPTVLTPHPGEFLRWGLGEATVEAAAAAAQGGLTVVLKGSSTWVLGEGRRAVWDGAEPALATGGSGDCLAGVVGAFLAAGLDGFQAACAAVALHGAAGKALARREGWFTAERLPEALALTASACRTAVGPL